MPNVNNTSLPGQVWTSKGDGTNAGYWGTLSELLAAKSSWVRQGPILVPSGANDNLPPDILYVPTGATLNLVVVYAIIGGGTSITFNVTHNGSTIAGLGSIVVEPFTSLAAMTYTPTNPEAIANGDFVQPVATAISSGPYDLSLICGYDWGTS